MAVTKVVTIEVNDIYTKMCEMSYNKKTPTVFKTACYENEAALVVDSKISDPDRYVINLKKELRKAGIKCKDVVWVLSSSKILSREVSIPEMKEKLIEGYIKGESASYFPVDVSDHVLSYTILEKDTENKKLQLLIYAAPMSLLLNYYDIADKAGLKIAAIDCSKNSMYQYFKNNPQINMDLYLQINESNTFFSIFEKERYVLNRSLKFGSHDMVEHLIDEDYFGEISVEEARQKLYENELIFPSYESMLDEEPLTEEEARLYECKKRLTDASRSLVAGVTRVLEYYNSSGGDEAVTNIYVGGSGARIKMLDVMLESEFDGVKFTVIDSLPNVKWDKKDKLMNANSTEFLSCIGAYKKTIDFKIETEASQRKSVNRFAVTAAGLTMVAMMAIMATALLNYKLALDEKEDLLYEISTYGNVTQLEADTNMKNARLADLSTFTEMTETNNKDITSLINKLEDILPTNTRVKNLSATESGVTMIMSLPNKKEATMAMLKLRDVEGFEDIIVNVVSDYEDEMAGNRVVEFTVTMAYPQPVEEEAPVTDGTEEGTEEGAAENTEG